MQASLFRISGKPLRVKERSWQTWSKRRLAKRGRYFRWGVIEELHEPDKLLCDFDSTDIPCPLVNSLVHTCGLKVRWQRWDRTRRGWHLIIKLRQHLTDGEIIACQAILGSDSARERLNIARAMSIRLHPSKFWKPRINILFKRKIKVLRSKRFGKLKKVFTP